jgi:hypothetical protein
MNPPFPPVANPEALIILNSVSDGPGLNPDARTRAGRAANRLRLAAALHSSGQMTTPELGDQFIHATATAIAGNPGGADIPAGAPAWVQGLVNQMNGFQNQMNARFDSLEARFINSTVREVEDGVLPLINAAGVPPPNFPNTLLEFQNLTAQQVTALLVYYQLPNAPAATRRIRLRRFLGLPQ